MLRLPDDAVAALRDLRDTAENPFYWRERRRDDRKGEPWKGVWNASFLVGFMFLTALFGLWFGLAYGAFPGIFQNGRIPAALGGQDGGRAAFAIVAGIHALVVYYTARNLANGQITGEVRRGTLFQLVMTRVPALEMMLEMIVYPFQQALLAAAAGLPVYAILVSFGSIGIQEVVVLYLLLVLLAVAVPNLRAPAFAEISPEEAGDQLRSQEQAAGCAAAVVTAILLPGTIFLGTALYWVHLSNPQLAARIPADVWPALPLFPLTFGWVIIRLLCAPYTWFGVPAPPWVWFIPLMLLYRFAALWRTSFYLRVSHYHQIYKLPDWQRLQIWRGDLRKLVFLAAAGYLWQPVMESGLFAPIFWSNAGNRPVDNLSALLALTAVGCFAFSLRRARTVARVPLERRRPVAETARYIAAPYAVLAIAVLAGAMTDPAALFTVTTVKALALLLPVCALHLLLALSAGPSYGGGWTALLILPLIAPLLPMPYASAIAPLSPIGAVLSCVPAFRDWMGVVVPLWSLPPWWSVYAALAAGLAICALLWQVGYFARKELWEKREPKASGRSKTSGYRRSSYGTPLVRTAPRQSAAPLEFTLDAAPADGPMPENGAKGENSALDFDIAPIPPVIASATVTPPPVLAAPQAHAVSPPPLAPFAPAGPPPPSAVRQEWRWRPVSPAGAAVMRWLAKRTDNPVALYSARRVLPGALTNDQLLAGGLILAVALFMALVFPDGLRLFVFSSPLAALVYPRGIFEIEGSVGGYGYYPDRASLLHSVDPSLAPIMLGMVLLVGALLTVSFLCPWHVSRQVADGFRMERERSTLGFLLMTPLTSRGVALGHCVGAVLPALAVWSACAGAAIVPTVVLAVMWNPVYAFAGWLVGFLASGTYLTMCALVGMWIGITEVKTRDMTIGVYMLPASFCTIAFGAAFLTSYYWRWNYAAYTSVYFGVCSLILLWLWRNAVKELHRMRHGDVAFEGRTVGS